MQLSLNLIMKKTILIALIALAGLTGALLLLNFKQKPQAPTNQILVAATIPPVGDMVWQIAGADSGLMVMTILPPGASPHTYEPTPEDMRDLQNARLIFTIGHGLDDWAVSLTANIPQVEIITMDQGLNLREHDHGHEEDELKKEDHEENKDPHYWLSVKNAKIMAGNITQALITLDPANEKLYAENLADYMDELNYTDEAIKHKFRDFEKRDILTYHNAWGYFADDYDLNVIGAFEANPGQEPTIDQLAELQTKIKNHGLHTIFIEPQLSEQVIKPFSQDLGLKTAVLDPLGGSDMGYTTLMLYNANAIAQSLFEQ